MKVSLVSYTRPAGILENTEIENLADLVAYCARVSNPANQMNSETSEKLIKYLLKNKHFSPFEMCDVTLEIETTRDISHQMVRHRSFSFQEFSQRYSNPQEMGEMFEKSEVRLQDNKNRQNSLPVNDWVLQALWDEKQRAITELAKSTYDWALEKGIAKEVARKILPEGLTKTRLFMKGSIRSWIHYLEVRGEGSGTQKEHMEVALEIAKIIHELFPVNLSK